VLLYQNLTLFLDWCIIEYMKEPKIMSMDWRSMGYWPVWKDGKKVWVPKDAAVFQEDQQD
jgi:hypothetical protein